MANVTLMDTHKVNRIRSKRCDPCWGAMRLRRKAVAHDKDGVGYCGSCAEFYRVHSPESKIQRRRQAHASH